MTPKILLLVVAVTVGSVKGRPEIPARPASPYTPPDLGSDPSHVPGFNAHTAAALTTPDHFGPSGSGPDPTYNGPEHPDPSYRSPAPPNLSYSSPAPPTPRYSSPAPPGPSYSSPAASAPRQRSGDRTRSRAPASPSYTENTHDSAPVQRPAQYNFQYDAQDAETGQNYGHQETREGYNTQGSYYVPLPDGRIQKVTYYVDGDSGYMAEVTYEGEATYPEPQQYGRESEPAYNPAPAAPRRRPAPRQDYRSTPAPSYEPAPSPAYEPAQTPSYETTPRPNYQPTSYRRRGPTPPNSYRETPDYEAAPSNEPTPTYEEVPSQEYESVPSTDYQVELPYA